MTKKRRRREAGLTRNLQCFAHGSDGKWEAICLDLDIAVTGRSFGEVQEILLQAVHSYIEDAAVLDPVSRKALLGRRAPWLNRLGYHLRYAFAFVGGSGIAAKARAGFGISCPA